MSTFYKMDPAAWDFGTVNLSLEEEAAYLRIVNAIHKHDGPVPNNDRVLAGLFRSSTRKARSLVAALIEAGKIAIDGGFIWNERARSDLVQRGFVSISRAEAGAEGGKQRAENHAARHNSQSVRAGFVTISTPELVTNPQRTIGERPDKSLKNKDTALAIACTRIEENRIEEEREAKASPKKSDFTLTKEALTEVLDDDLAEAFIAHRIKLKKPMTPYAAKLIAGKLIKAPDPAACAQLSIVKGWQDVFPDSPQAAQHKGGAVTAGSDWWGGKDL